MVKQSSSDVPGFSEYIIINPDHSWYRLRDSYLKRSRANQRAQSCSSHTHKNLQRKPVWKVRETVTITWLHQNRAILNYFLQRIPGPHLCIQLVYSPCELLQAFLHQLSPGNCTPVVRCILNMVKVYQTIYPPTPYTPQKQKPVKRILFLRFSADTLKRPHKPFLLEPWSMKKMVKSLCAAGQSQQTPSLYIKIVAASNVFLRFPLRQQIN